jgi:hypothetical protein
MSSQAAPAVHSVQFYDESKGLIDRLCGLITSSLRLGNSVLLVITLKHRVQLVKAMAEAEIEVRDSAREGRFVMADAGETLQHFMVDGLPDPKRFHTSVGRLLHESREAALAPAKNLMVFGEMVAVLWDENNQRGAIALEELWNDVLSERAFHLHCAYPRYSFVKDPDHLRMLEICKAHTHVI